MATLQRENIRPMASRWHELAGKIREKLAGLASRHADEKDEVLETILLLDGLESLYRGRRDGEKSSPKPRDTSRLKYRKRVKGSELCLAEFRPGGGQPFLVGESVYNAAVKVMAKVHEPTEFSNVHHQVSAVVGENLPDYLVRTMLRFWQQKKLVGKVRTRYRVTPGGSFAKDAITAFESLPPDKSK